MTFKALRAITLVLGLVLCSFGWAANTPTVHDVYVAAQSGNLAQAQQMIEQVLVQYPQSGKAHYVAAEVYAKQGKLALARSELRTSEQLEPGLPFAKPQSVDRLKQTIAAGSGVIPARTGAPSGGFSWGWVLLIVGTIVAMVLISRRLGARNSPQGMPTYMSPGAGNPGSGGQPMPGYAPVPPQGGGMGSGIMGTLATGAALGAGMVAGQALAHRLMDGGHSDTNAVVPDQGDMGMVSSNDMGGQDFGITSSDSWGDSSSLADMSGNDDWT